MVTDIGAPVVLGERPAWVDFEARPLELGPDTKRRASRWFQAARATPRLRAAQNNTPDIEGPSFIHEKTPLLLRQEQHQVESPER